MSRYKPCEVLPCQPGREEHLKCVYFVIFKIDGEQRNVRERHVSGSLNQYYKGLCITQLLSLVSRIFRFLCSLNVGNLELCRFILMKCMWLYTYEIINSYYLIVCNHSLTFERSIMKASSRKTLVCFRKLSGKFVLKIEKSIMFLTVTEY